jgi:uncharacterized protein YicC (UPF0701 family)
MNSPSVNLEEAWQDKRWWWLLSPAIPLAFTGSLLAFVWTGQWWCMLLAPMVIHVFLPVLDRVLGEDFSNPPESAVAQLEQDERTLSSLLSTWRRAVEALGPTEDEGTAYESRQGTTTAAEELAHWALAQAALAALPGSRAQVQACDAALARLAAPRDVQRLEEERAAIEARARETDRALSAAEGAVLASLIGAQLEGVARLTEAATQEAAARRAAAAGHLREALAKVLDNVDGVDETRLAQELALLAVKNDVTEELDRLRAHIGAARALLADGGPVGRKFDFLMQEFMREANTLCSKAQSMALTRIGLDLKTVIDQMREQVQNVE